MSNPGSADLNSIAQQMTGLLEARISDLLGHVKASREVTQQLLDTDAELKKLQGARARLSAILGPLEDEDAPEAQELRRRLESVEDKVQKLTGQRKQLVDRLEVLKSKLDA